MHELGVLTQVVKDVEDIARDNNLDKVAGVVLDIGELTGMMPFFFEEYYDMVTEGHPILEGSKVIIEETPGVGRCSDCGEEYNVARCEGECPKCGSRYKEILSGTDFLIKEILVTEETAAATA